MTQQKKDTSATARVARCRARAINAGARRVGPVLLKDKSAIEALDYLTAIHGSQRAAIERALNIAKDF